MYVEGNLPLEVSRLHDKISFVEVFFFFDGRLIVQ